MEIGTDKQEKTIRLLSKLLSAAEKAQAEGKHIALSKIIKEASRISTHLNRSAEAAFLARENLSYRPVTGVIID
jgi:hypothetical protein